MLNKQIVLQWTAGVCVSGGLKCLLCRLNNALTMTIFRRCLEIWLEVIAACNQFDCETGVHFAVEQASSYCNSFEIQVCEDVAGIRINCAFLMQGVAQGFSGSATFFCFVLFFFFFFQITFYTDLKSYMKLGICVALPPTEIIQKILSFIKLSFKFFRLSSETYSLK